MYEEIHRKHRLRGDLAYLESQLFGDHSAGTQRFRRLSVYDHSV